MFIEKAPKSMMNATINILLVEDNPTDAELALRILDSCDNRSTVHLKDGEEALTHLFGTKDGAFIFDLPRVIFLDLKLPKVNGHEVLKQIKTHHHLKMIPVVILTSSNEESDVNLSYALGANSYVVKPIAYAELKETLNETCEYWLKTNRSAPKLLKAHSGVNSD